MSEPKRNIRGLVRAMLLLVVALRASQYVNAQKPVAGPFDQLPEPVLPRELAYLPCRQFADSSAPNRPASVRLFSMPSALPVFPPGLDTDDDFSVTGCPGVRPDSRDDDRLQIGLGGDNPFFDFRRPGDPGGIGYYRLYSQMLLWGSTTSAACLGLQAYTPAGLEADGVENGPTVLIPNFAWLYDLGGGTAIQGFVGQNLRAYSRWDSTQRRALKYGMALQSPCLGSQCYPGRSIHFFVEALGRYRYQGDSTQGVAGKFELLPGIQWRLSDSWWFSGGVLMPFGAAKSEPGRLQITGSWRF